MNKPVIGISCGDINGIGLEVIVKTFLDSRMLDYCTPVIFAQNKLVNFYRKTLPQHNFNFTGIRDFEKITPKQINIFNCWEEDVNVTPGVLNETGGAYAIQSLLTAATALKEKHIDALVTAPIHKKNVQSDTFPFTGHTPFLESFFEADEVLMFMVAGNFRVGLVTEHLPVADVAGAITREKILNKLRLMNASLRRDFNITKPKIAVLALNPHAGDEGLIGTEEETVLKPAIEIAREKIGLVFGPFPADAFFARNAHHEFDGVLAMYHDQGLIPFKSLQQEEGVNFTAGLESVRTSPDHGTAFDIAAKNLADESSFRAAVFKAIDILGNRQEYDENHADPLQPSRGSHKHADRHR